MSHENALHSECPNHLPLKILWGCEHILLKALSSSPWKYFSLPIFLTSGNSTAMHSVLILDIWEGFIDTSFLPSRTTSQWATQFFFFFFFVSRIYFYSLSSHYHLSSVLQQKLLNCLFHLAFINPLLSELVSFTFHIVWCYHIAFLRKKNLYIVYRVFHDLPSSTASTFTGISLNFLEFIRSLPTRGNGLKYAVSLAWNQAILLRLAEDYSWFKYYLNMTA